MKLARMKPAAPYVVVISIICIIPAKAGMKLIEMDEGIF